MARKRLATVSADAVAGITSSMPAAFAHRGREVGCTPTGALIVTGRKE
jgi:hypothetical protein